MKTLVTIIATMLSLGNINVFAQESDYLSEAETFQLLQEDERLLWGNECHFAERDNNLQLLQRCAAATKRHTDGCTPHKPCTIRRTSNIKTELCRGRVCQSMETNGVTINGSSIKANTIKVK